MEHLLDSRVFDRSAITYRIVMESDRWGITSEEILTSSKKIEEIIEEYPDRNIYVNQIAFGNDVIIEEFKLTSYIKENMSFFIFFPYDYMNITRETFDKNSLVVVSAIMYEMWIEGKTLRQTLNEKLKQEIFNSSWKG